MLNPVTLTSGGRIQVRTTGVAEDTSTWQYWLMGADDQYQPLTLDQAFAHKLWLNFLDLGTAMDPPSGYALTQDALREAVLSMPHVMETIAAGGYSEADVWDYAIDLVGIA